MKILKTLVYFSGDLEFQGQICAMDTIEFEGKMWLVPVWLDNREEGFSYPARIILLDTLPHEKSRSPLEDFLLTDPLPKAVFDGQVPPESELDYVVVERPDIQVRDRRALH